MDDFSKLQETEHMLKRFSDEPYAAIRSSVEDMLKQQVKDSRLVEFKVVSEPQWLTGVRPSDADSNKAVIVRAAIAFEFVLSVLSQGESQQLAGVFTLAATHLDEPEQREQRVWMDLDGTLETFGSQAELINRIYFE